MIEQCENDAEQEEKRRSKRENLYQQSVNRSQPEELGCALNAFDEILTWLNQTAP